MKRGFWSYIDPEESNDETSEQARSQQDSTNAAPQSADGEAGSGSSVARTRPRTDVPFDHSGDPSAHRESFDQGGDDAAVRTPVADPRGVEKAAKAREKAEMRSAKDAAKQQAKADAAARKEAEKARKAAKKAESEPTSGGVEIGEHIHQTHSHASHSHEPSHHETVVPSGRDGGALRGLAAGMATTAKTMTKKTATQQYPDVNPDLPSRSRGVIALLEENCTVCMLCARECPDWCLYIDSHKETVPPETEGGRARQKNVLDRFAIDFSLCMYCGICIEVCPFDALYWSPEFEYAATDIRELLQEKEQLGEWMRTVPAPDDLDERAPEAPEVASANKPARVVRRQVQR